MASSSFSTTTSTISPETVCKVIAFHFKRKRKPITFTDSAQKSDDLQNKRFMRVGLKGSSCKLSEFQPLHPLGHQTRWLQLQPQTRNKNTNKITVNGKSQCGRAILLKSRTRNPRHNKLRILINITGAHTLYHNTEYRYNATYDHIRRIQTSTMSRSEPARTGLSGQCRRAK